MREDLGLGHPKGFYQERREMTMGHSQEMASAVWVAGDWGPAVFPPCTC